MLGNSYRKRSTDKLDVVGKVSECMVFKGKSSAVAWRQVQFLLGVINALLGALFLLWAAASMGEMEHQHFGMLLGIVVIVMGAAGIVSYLSNAPSGKSLQMVVAALVVMMAYSFNSQIRKDVEQDCWMSETWIKLNHLEDALLELRHGELIDSLMIRLNSLHDQLEDVEKGAADVARHRVAQEEFHSMDAQYVQEKLSDLTAMAEESYNHLDLQILQLSLNISAAAATAADAARPLHEKQQLQEQLKQLQERKAFLHRHQDVLRDLSAQLHAHKNSHEQLSPDEYERMLKTLDWSSAKPEVVRALKEEHEHMPFVQSAMARLAENNYSSIHIPKYGDRIQHRATERQRQHHEFEDHYNRVVAGTENKFDSRDKYLNSLHEHLQHLPGICMRELSEFWAGSLLSWVMLLSAGAVGYVALTESVVKASQKEF